MAKKGVNKENTSLDKPTISYVLGILSIVFGILKPDAGLVLGIIGLIMSSKERNSLEKKAKTLSIIGIIVSIIILIIVGIALSRYSLFR